MKRDWYEARPGGPNSGTWIGVLKETDDVEAEEETDHRRKRRRTSRELWAGYSLVEGCIAEEFSKGRTTRNYKERRNIEEKKVKRALSLRHGCRRLPGIGPRCWRPVHWLRQSWNWCFGGSKLNVAKSLWRDLAAWGNAGFLVSQKERTMIIDPMTAATNEAQSKTTDL